MASLKILIVDMNGMGLYFISIHETDFDWLKEWKK